MNRNFSSRFDSIGEIPPVVREEPEVEELTAFDKTLLLIFGPDPNTGIPNSDLRMWVNSNTRPEIKQFIEQNLLIDTTRRSSLELSTDEVNAFNKHLNDDDIAYYTRWLNESKQQYAARMRSKFMYEYNEAQKKKKSSNKS